jgi:hypothetical protein
VENVMMFDNIKNLLSQYTAGTASSQDADAHFQQIAQSAAPTTLAPGIAEAMRSNQTPPFGELIAQLFTNGSGDQKAGALNALLAAASPELRAQLSAVIPGLLGSAPVTATQAASVSPGVVTSLATKVEQHNPGVIDTMSGFYAQHPGLVRTLGTTALMIAMRTIAQRQA